MINADGRGTGLLALLKIFAAPRKFEIKRIAKDTIVAQHDFVSLILACERGQLPWRHVIHHREYRPPELKLTDDDLKAMSTNGVGQLKPRAAKAFAKVTQTFEARRLLIGHLFYTADHANWHLIYFDQRDIDDRNNHWVEGSHIHLINHLWPEHDMKALWIRFISENLKLSGAVHIRFENRKDFDAT